MRQGGMLKIGKEPLTCGDLQLGVSGGSVGSGEDVAVEVAAVEVRQPAESETPQPPTLVLILRPLRPEKPTNEPAPDPGCFTLPPWPRGQAEVLWLGGQAQGRVGLAGDAGSEQVEAVVGGDES